MMLSIAFTAYAGHACGLAAGMLILHLPGLKNLLGAAGARAFVAFTHNRTKYLNKAPPGCDGRASIRGGVIVNRKERGRRSQRSWIKTCIKHLLCAAGVFGVQYILSGNEDTWFRKPGFR
eukprot:scaffold175152_cov31-Prasinocladus_malaysianus.AAC.1